MEPPANKNANTAASASADIADGERCRSVVVELPLGDAVDTFDLEKAVCSHGLFMMAPNHWDPLSKTLKRPLRLDSNEDTNSSSSLLVQISHPSHTPGSLSLRVFGTDSLSPLHQKSLLDQVRRMLRLSQAEERNLREFREVYGGAKERGFGRVFRSPTLFEDMVKCILLCNCQFLVLYAGEDELWPQVVEFDEVCSSSIQFLVLYAGEDELWPQVVEFDEACSSSIQWSRTLSMARALCELQLELQCPLLGESIAKVDNGSNISSPTAKTEDFAPTTPQKELKRKTPSNGSTINNQTNETVTDHFVPTTPAVKEKQKAEALTSLLSSHKEEDYCKHCDSFWSSIPTDEVNSRSSYDLQSNRIGNFPSPGELAKLDEKFLAKRCNLGYRASRILSLAKSVVEGRIQLRQLEEASSELSLSNYDKLGDQLKGIDGFGPFTCANVLMCMGFYHVIPTDSETIRHLKQVHAVSSTVQTVKERAEVMYEKYAPFQFLAYWSEVWSFYEERFGKTSEMPHSDYKLITAANMRPKASRNQKKRTKRSL
ncbi:hypothetical protein LguiB_021669 [Lonicera macranthoides]